MFVKKLGIIKFVSLFFLCFALVIGCTQKNKVTTTTSTTPSIRANEITIGTTLKPRTLDPADSYEIAGLNVIYNVGESLYTYELGTTKLKPLLAKDFPKISSDNLTYTIPLREGVKFHDGTPFNAEAMAFSLNRFIQNGGKPSFLLSDIVANVKAKGESELVIKLKQPFSPFTSLLAFPGACAVSPQGYKIGAQQFNPNSLIGTGPYKLVDFNSDSVRLTRFDGYWGEKPANEGVNIQIYAGNSANLFNGFRTSAIDVAYQSLDPEQIETLQTGGKENKWQVIEAPGTAVNYMILNINQKPLDEPKVRQAIAALMNRSLLIERVLKGQSEPVYSLVPTAFDVNKPTFKEAYGDSNIEKAKQLIQEAGYSAAKPIVVQIWYPSGSTTREIVAQTLKAIVEKELGGAVKFEPQTVESASFFSNVSKGIYPTALADWYPDFLDADNYLQPFMACSKGSAAKGCEEGAAQSRGSFYYSDRANQLIEQQRKERDSVKRKEIFSELQELLAKDVPYIPLWQTKDYAFARNGVTGVTINPSQNFPFWTIKK
jgi:peptide/nickel transport system substrate-binding protein